VILRCQGQQRRACMIRELCGPEAQVTEGHPHNADERASGHPGDYGSH
jgi:hypothetical protein